MCPQPCVYTFYFFYFKILLLPRLNCIIKQFILGKRSTISTFVGILLCVEFQPIPGLQLYNVSIEHAGCKHGCKRWAPTSLSFGRGRRFCRKIWGAI
jgi:hypothetical protein